MSLLIRIAELALIIIAVRTFLRMLLPAMRKQPPPRGPSAKSQRFNEDKCDISDADYEELK